MTRRVTFWSAAALACALTAAGCSSPDTPSADPSASAGGSFSPPAVQSNRPADGTLSLGYVLPETGSLSGLGPGVIAATELAVADINAAGGVLGKDVTLTGGDEAGDATVAGQTVDRQLNAGVDAIIGPVSSAISLSVIDKITQAGALQCAGSNTSKTFSTYADRGLYFRTIPANIKQGPVLAQAVIADGASRVAIVVRNDDYGQSLSQAVSEQLTAEGAEVVANVPYDPAATTFTAEVGQVAAAKPDAVVVIAFQEGSTLLRGLIEKGVGPGDVQVFGTDGMTLGTLGSTVDPADPGRIEGMSATQASSQNDPEFLTRLVKEHPEVKVTNFSPYHYDCAITIALAAAAAKSDAAGDIANAMHDVTTGGEKCTTFAACTKLLAAGKDIDYDGVSGPLDLNEVGEPSTGLFDVVTFDATGTPTIVRTVESK